MARLLVVDDERTQRALLERFLTNDGYEVESASDGAAALELVQSTPVDLVITDLRMPGMNGRELLAKLQQLDPTLPVIIMTAYADLRDAVDFVTHAGAFYYIEKPIEDMKILRGEIERALAAKEKPHAHASEASEPSELGESVFPEMIGNSSPMARLKREMQKLLPILGGPATVLITGESGTGKELVAEALHRYGPRKNAPFVPVHCAAIPDDLMEAELFGSERGAYTGSTGTRAG
ncbi:MAG: response regulator, partial [Candidatus Poribacteria bacterium]|nr:response regulator [Candidatus Poribacteria bacterium]